MTTETRRSWSSLVLESLRRWLEMLHSCQIWPIIAQNHVLFFVACRYWCDESTEVVEPDHISDEAKRAKVVSLMIMVQDRYWKWTSALRIMIRRIWILQWSSTISVRRVIFGREKSRSFSSLFGPELEASSLDNFFFL